MAKSRFDITPTERAGIKGSILALLEGDGWTEDHLVTIKAEIDTLFHSMDKRAGTTDFSKQSTPMTVRQLLNQLHVKSLSLDSKVILNLADKLGDIKDGKGPEPQDYQIHEVLCVDETVTAILVEKIKCVCSRFSLLLRDPQSI